MTRPDPPDLLSALARFIGTTPEALAGGDPEGVRQRLDRIQAALSKLVAAGARRPVDDAEPEGLSADIAALRDSFARAGIGAAGVGEPGQADAARLAAAGGAVDAATMARALDTLAKLFEAKDPGAGSAIDAMIAELESAFGGAAAASEAERDRRIGSDARAAIAERLRRAGIKPSGDA
ncbi:MAG TPA: hypothetical protein VEL05_01175 [Candidatus Acidoferrum sp.]|nr:hypothetical protein [Candidatus Acidoferrum sp.]